MAELEKVGIPTVTFVARDFLKDWQHSAPVFGVEHLPHVIVPHPFIGLDAGDIQPHVDAAFDSLVKMLREPAVPAAGKSEKAPATPAQSDIIAVEGDDPYVAFQRMNRMFLDEGWGDGFPLWAPTRKAVDEMLAGTRKSPDHVMAILAPGFGVATVEKIAINAVMAGCRPEHMPLLLAAIEAISDPRFMLRNVAMSTGSHAPFMLVSGPIAKRLGVNAGRCALGPGVLSQVNTVLGRAIRLFYMNLGHAYPGVMDMDTLGTPNKYSMCLAENVEDSPWEPYHVEKGFDVNDSVVTMGSTYALCEVDDHTGTTPEAVLNVACATASNQGVKSVGFWLLGQRGDPLAGVQAKDKHFLIVCPVHAAIFKKYGWSKQQIRDYLYKNARLPFGRFMANKEPATFRTSHPKLQFLWDSPDTLMPVLETVDCFEIIVAGASGGRSAYSYGAAEPISKRIEQ
jgi:hypothetical protein